MYEYHGQLYYNEYCHKSGYEASENKLKMQSGTNLHKKKP